MQRVASGRVTVGDETVGEVERGPVVLLGVARGDSDADAVWIANKIAALRIFEDADGRMNLSVGDVGGSILLVSQFTLLASCRKGRRPSFVGAAPPDAGRRLYEAVGALLVDRGLRVETGRFGERMMVSIENEGPVTIILDSQEAGSGPEPGDASGVAREDT
jgi:D-tyrosyl-tRNA(Tyr) deacylase